MDKGTRPQARSYVKAAGRRGVKILPRRGLNVATLKSLTIGDKRQPRTEKLDYECPFELLPDEVIITIFLFLDVKSVLSCASVCRRWSSIASDNAIWRSLYFCHLQKSEAKPGNPSDRSGSSCEDSGKIWKYQFLAHCKTLRNERFQTLDKKYTLINYSKNTGQIMKKLGVKFQLSLDTRSGLFRFMGKKRKHFQTSTLLFWSSLKPWPKMCDVFSIQVHAIVPLMFGVDRKPVPNSPCQKSLIFDERVAGRLTDCPAVRETAEIRLHQSKQNMLFATWQGTSEFAFMTLALHNYGFLEKCLFSRSSSIHTTPYAAQPVLANGQYDLRGCKCHRLLHGSDCNLMTEMLNINDAIPHVNGDKAHFILDNFQTVDDFLWYSVFNWKTDRCIGRIEMVFVAITVTNANADVIWSCCSPFFYKNSRNEDVDLHKFTEPLELSYENQSGGFSLTLKPHIWSYPYVDTSRRLRKTRIPAILFDTHVFLSCAEQDAS